MSRVISLSVIGVLALIALLSGCGGDSGTGSGGKGTLIIAFDNRYGGTGEDGTHVIIPGSGHDFYMDPDEYKVIEVTPPEGASTVLVRIERKAWRTGLPPVTREVEVGNGKTIIITHLFQVDVTDGITEPERKWD